MFENLTPLTLSVDRGWEHPDFTGAKQRVPLLKLILREIGRASWSYHSLLNGVQHLEDHPMTCKCLITMVIVSPLTGEGPLPNGLNGW